MDHSNQSKLIIVKTVHTAVWSFFHVVLVYLFYAVITNQVGVLFWVGVGLIIVEFFVLLANNWTCPLSPIARKYTNSERANYDIYLPEWLAHHNKTIYTSCFLILCVFYVFYQVN